MFLKAHMTDLFPFFPTLCDLDLKKKDMLIYLFNKYSLNTYTIPGLSEVLG